MPIKFLRKALSPSIVSLSLATGLLLTVPCTGYCATVPKKPVYPPRIYFTQASLNKSGTVSAIQGEDNFLRLFLPAIDTSKHPIPASGVICKVWLPDGVTLLPEPDQFLHIQRTTLDGRPMQEVSFALAEKEVTRLSQSTASGKLARIEITLWFRADDLRTGENYPIGLAVEMQGKTCFNDDAKLHVYGPLKPITPVHPEHFRFWLHYGPHYRADKWDELAASLRRYGFNTVQVLNTNVEKAKELKERGFSIISHRLGSYMKSHHPGSAVSKTVAEGPAWFAKEDDGKMNDILQYSDVATWDFEPSPRGIVTDEPTLALFREFAKISAGEPLDERTIKEKYMKPWIAFRQKQFATILKNWADWVRSVKSDVKTLVSEGSVGAFDPSGQIDYRNWGDSISYVDPMGFSGPGAIRGMRQWKAVTPNLAFMGCQNVAQDARSPVTVSADTIMLLTLSAALMGNEGTGIYPGQTMDAENFVKFNRVMGFLGENQEIIWNGTTEPKELSLRLLPKQNETITLGTGDTLQNVYPDWGKDAVAQTYKSKSGDAYLTGIVNWNSSEPCYAKIQLDGLSGKWMLTDDESRRVYTFDGKTELDAAVLAKGAIVFTPASDYRGFRVAKFNSKAAEGYEEVSLERLEKEFSVYSGDSGKEKNAGTEEGSIRFDYDDIDGDRMIEYVVTTGSQKVWVNQLGRIVRWQSGGGSLEGALAGDQLWLPVGERNSAFPNAAMNLESRQSGKDHAEIVFTRDVVLPSLGSMMQLQMRKKMVISSLSGEISVETTITNTSLAAQSSTIELSYRVHNKMDYNGDVSVWTNDGTALAVLDPVRRFYVPNAGLDARSTQLLHATYPKFPERNLKAFGDYRPKDQTLVSFVPDKADELLQMLRWQSEDHRIGTIEWVYRPVTLNGGESWKTDYRITLKGNIASLEQAAPEKRSSAR